ncbi:hypothetical protein J2W36_003596 [Variovorax ginsengisoli]|uniref:Uncharacterized protein n=1 Tax=Variovorax ginsengisoli TaxID=363844 RepID=A0ABT9SAE3_9BURK|nr:hypothetical protein [Variovorax ginsengisoli]
MTLSGTTVRTRADDKRSGPPTRRPTRTPSDH